MWQNVKKYYNIDTCGLYYKQFMIVIYNGNAIGQYYETMSIMIVDNDRS